MTSGKAQIPPGSETALSLKRLTRRLAIIFAVVVLGVAGIVGWIEFQANRSQKEISALAAQLVPGTSFATVIDQLGSPTRTLTTPDEIKAFGTRTEPAFIKDSNLHMFMRSGPPYRWLLVYTDRQSKRVSYTTWKDM